MRHRMRGGKCDAATAPVSVSGSFTYVEILRFVQKRLTLRPVDGLALLRTCDGSCWNLDGGGRGNTDFMRRSARLLWTVWRYVERRGYVAGDGRQRGRTGSTTFWIPSTGRVTGGGAGKLGRLVQYGAKTRLWVVESDTTWLG
jgi:hypothetical protein